MINKIKNIGSWIFTGITILGLLILSNGIGFETKYIRFGTPNIWFVIIGSLMCLPAIIYFIKLKLDVKQIENEDSLRIEKLKKEGNKVKIDLDEIEIQSNNYQQEVIVGSGYKQSIDYVDVNHNVILLDVNINKEKIKYRVDINMELTKLKMHLAIKKFTYLYVDNLNTDNHYLDLEFLD